ncbi:MAG: penicillin-binding protein, partial [Flavobacteriaceae bacterium]|nr:penicillin-binding protein [Flavobacteriaceae bacterium]
MLKKLLKYFSILIVIGSILFGLFIVAVYKGAFGELHTEEDLKDFKNQTASIIYADNGEILGKFFAENRTNIQFEQLPKQLVNALVATEDARYFEHEGVDSRSMLRVLFKSILLNNKNAGGGSTITQQLAKNMYGRERFGPLTMLVNKTKEAILATKLEEVYSKEEILTLYLNTVPFGENIYGIEAASRRFFNKPVTDIKIEEAAVLIGMLKANTYYNPRLYPDNALQRRNVVLSQMEKYEYLNSSTKDSLQQLPLQLDYADLESEGPANYFLVHVKKEAQQILDKYNKDKEEKYDLEKDGLIITTTLDYTLQKQALNAFKKHLGSMQKKLSNEYRNGNKKNILENLVNQELKSSGLSSKANERKNREIFDWNGFYIDSISVKDSVRNSLTLLHAGLLAMNPQTGAVKAWVGGIDYK